MTLNQLITKAKNKVNKSSRKKKIILVAKEKPQLKGICIKVLTMKPKKPNSALRKIAKVQIHGGKIVTAYIPGIGHNLTQHSIVLIKPGATQDLPGVNYKVIRGVFGCGPVIGRANSRSKYGVKKNMNK